MSTFKLELPPPFEEAVKAMEREIMRFLVRSTGDRDDAMDLFQETWLRAYRAYPTLQSADGLRPWVFRIASNLCRNRARDRMRRGRVISSERGSRRDRESRAGASQRRQPRGRARLEAIDRAAAGRAGTGVDDAQVREIRICGDRSGAGLLGRKRARERFPGAEKIETRRVIKMKSDRTAARDNESIGDRAIDAMIGQTRPRIERAMKILQRPQARVGVIPSQLGRLIVAESDRGIAGIHFLWTDGAERMLAMLRQKFDLIENEASARRVEAEIDRVFKGDFAALAHPLDLSLVESDFKRRAYVTLRKVPPGAVITYHQLAAAIGQPDAQRAVGTTMATNPIPIFVPCHRVIRSNGTIGNYGGGVDNKIKLLGAEGFEVGRDLRLPSGAVMGHRHTRSYCRPTCSAARRGGCE